MISTAFNDSINKHKSRLIRDELCQFYCLYRFNFINNSLPVRSYV